MPFPDDVQLRPASPADALCLGALATQVFYDTYATEGINPTFAREALARFSTETLAAEIAAANSEFVVAERREFVIGFARLLHGERHELVKAEPSCELDRLYVQERFTGAGLGRRLLQAAEARAAARGAGALWLTAWVGNARALAFYPRCGYRDVGSTPYVIEGVAYENRLFLKELAA
jgi:GNAT superfamily N-acetyltransferase